jgi:hypothetical protein
MLDINMIRKLFIVFVLLLSSFVYSQKNYINYNLMGQTQYVGIGWERSYLKRTISHEIGLGVLSLSLGIRGYLFKDVNRFYFGCSHLKIIRYILKSHKNSNKSQTNLPYNFVQLSQISAKLLF